MIQRKREERGEDGGGYVKERREGRGKREEELMIKEIETRGREKWWQNEMGRQKRGKIWRKRKGKKKEKKERGMDIQFMLKKD